MSPIDLETIAALLDERKLEAARAALDKAPESDERFAVARIRLGLYEGSLAPEAATQELIRLMRRDANLPGAREVYQEASILAYEARQSNVAYSHPPPPVMPNGEAPPRGSNG
ncbi:MAG TPA: hypothetical protein VKY73_10220 [Polyangiaceae bacterium]|nr:hypothetical protein [Polyangiaceae bacterium]